jgi:3-methyladenine DNA glycosylase AlkD
MQAYMKSEMPQHGVPTPVMRALCKRLFADLTFANRRAWESEVRAIWKGARFREERHAAIELTGHKRARPFQTVEALPLYEHLIVTGAWWDYVDTLAVHRVGPLFRDDAKAMKQAMLAWSRSEDLWKRRAAIICQLAFKADTDLPLLYACIEPALSSKAFFLRKAIGWALRELGKTQPAEVKRYVRAHQNALSPLSQREALKNLG